jgi:hypothetical protein
MRACACFGLSLGFGVAAGAPSATPVEVVHELRLVDGVLPAGQRLITARQGDTLRLRASSNTAGELHLHAYRLSLALQAGQPAERAFTAYASGRFRFEWHAARTSGAAPPADHHAAPLAVLEVRPP